MAGAGRRVPVQPRVAPGGAGGYPTAGAGVARGETDGSAAGIRLDDAGRAGEGQSRDLQSGPGNGSGGAGGAVGASPSTPAPVPTTQDTTTVYSAQAMQQEERKDRDRNRDKDKEKRDRDKDRDKDKERERRSSSHSKRHDSREREREREKERERELREREREIAMRDGRRFKHKKESEPEADPERDQRTVYAYQMPLKATESDVYEFFSKAGKVRDVRVIMDRNSRQSKGVGYIEFYDAMSVPTAITLSGQLLLGQPLMVKPLEAEKNLVQPTATYGGSSVTGSSSAMCTQNPSQRGFRVAHKRRNPRYFVRHRTSDAEAIAFPLGMSIAAVMAQVFESTDAAWKEMHVKHLSMICTSAVRESLNNVFGDKFEPFASNFEKAFDSTLKTLQLVKSSSVESSKDHSRNSIFKDSNTRTTPILRKCSQRSFNDNVSQSDSRRLDTNDWQTDSLIHTALPEEESSIAESSIENQPTVTQELSLHAPIDRELTCDSRLFPRENSMITTFEKSVVEQTRANDLKAFEIGLTMKKLHLKETQLALSSDLNFLERCKLSMGISKVSFQAEKYKTRMEDTRHAELIRNCIDCLVAGLLIMSSLIIYGTYVYSYKRIMEATSSCYPIAESNSWWGIPRPMSSLNSGLQTLRCQLQVISRMLFGLLIILAIGYSIFQRAAAPKQTMPVTFILLLLGVCCGVVGKFCIDTLGGSGYHWLMYWEMFCSLHFFVHMFTSFVFSFLYGPIKVSQGMERGGMLPFWVRRVLFYVLVLLVLPMLTGLVPFASLGEWKNHFFSLVSNLLLVVQDGD